MASSDALSVPFCDSSSSNKLNAIWRSVRGTDPLCTKSLLTTCRRNFIERSSTSSHNDDTCVESNSEASGRLCIASNASDNNSLHSSVSSPERQARRKNANEKFNAARVPTRANPNVAFSIDAFAFCCCKLKICCSVLWDF